MRVRADALSSDPTIEQFVRDTLGRTSSAVSAVTAGFFLAAGSYDEVLLGPTVLLVAGVGSGARVFDGRLRQPGIGARRPRGFLETDQVPVAARVALPTTVPALSLALAYQGKGSLTGLVRGGVQAAESLGKKSRAAVIQRIGAVGAQALSESSFTQPVLHLASPSEGGLLTQADFAAAAEDLSAPALEHRSAGSLSLSPPFDAPSTLDESLGFGEAIVAVDTLGVFAALCYRRLGPGLRVDALDLVAPLSAAPVLRGKARVRPGARLLSPAPVALRCSEAGMVLEVFARPRAATADAPEGAVMRIARSSARWVEASRH
jgi:gamma-glutamyltranspeptidase/glutathione hydrolase